MGHRETLLRNSAKTALFGKRSSEQRAAPDHKPPASKEILWQAGKY
jgi:hypothetical protein